MFDNQRKPEDVRQLLPNLIHQQARLQEGEVHEADQEKCKRRRRAEISSLIDKNDILFQNLMCNNDIFRHTESDGQFLALFVAGLRPDPGPVADDVIITRRSGGTFDSK